MLPNAEMLDSLLQDQFWRTWLALQQVWWTPQNLLCPPHWACDCLVQASPMSASCTFPCNIVLMLWQCRCIKHHITNKTNDCKIWRCQGNDLVMTLYSLVVWHISTHSTWACRMTHGRGVKAWLFNNNINISWKMGWTNQQMQSEGESDIKYWQSKSWPWMWCNDKTVPARERK